MRHKFQRGQLFKSKDAQYWHGRFYVHEFRSGVQKATRKSVTIGMVDFMTIAEARRVLMERIKLENENSSKVRIMAGAVDGTAKEVPQSAKGAYGELLVGMDLMKRGLEVFRNLNPQGRCDLVALFGGATFKVEVKFAGPTRGKRIIRTVIGSGRFDLLAVVSCDESIEYLDRDGKKFQWIERTELCS